MHFKETLEKRVQENLNFIQILLGPRQVGKTTAIKEVLGKWEGSKIFETADSPTVSEPSWITVHWARAKQLPPPTLLVLDEIQKIPEWSEKVKILFDESRALRTLRVVLLGSASLTLQEGLSESLVGRYELVKAYHWSYEECYLTFGWDLTTYLKFGGYPGGAELINDTERWKEFMHASVLEPVLASDIMGTVSIGKPALFRQTCALCLKYPAQELSLNKILGSLQDKGNVTTIRHYLNLLEGAFLIKTLSKFSGSAVATKSSIPKIVPLAPALIHALTDPRKIDQDPDWKGRVFESIIGAALCRLSGTLYYWREGNYEVDYVLVKDETIHAIEVKSDRLGKKQNGLTAFHKRYPNAHLHVVDMHNFQEVLSTIAERS